MQSRAALRSVQVDSSMDGLQMIELYNASSLPLPRKSDI